MKRTAAFLLAGVVVAAMSLVAGGAAVANQLDEIKKKGVLVVGVKTDYPPGACAIPPAPSSAWSPTWRPTSPSASA